MSRPDYERFYSSGTLKYTCFLPGWSGAEIKCTVHVALPKRPINRQVWWQQSRQKALRAYCPNIDTVSKSQRRRGKVFSPLSVMISHFVQIDTSNFRQRPLFLQKCQNLFHTYANTLSKNFGLSFYVSGVVAWSHYILSSHQLSNEMSTLPWLPRQTQPENPAINLKRNCFRDSPTFTESQIYLDTISYIVCTY